MCFWMWGVRKLRAVVTRVKNASVTGEGNLNASIARGLLVLLGVGPEDDSSDVNTLAKKICRLRIFNDEQGKMNLDLAQVQGEIMVVSQFTLYADTKSRRPGFSHGAKPDLANKLYEEFLLACEKLGFPPKHGNFGADMQVASVNDGPVTLCLDTKKEVNVH